MGNKSTSNQNKEQNVQDLDGETLGGVQQSAKLTTPEKKKLQELLPYLNCLNCGGQINQNKSKELMGELKEIFPDMNPEDFQKHLYKTSDPFCYKNCRTNYGYDTLLKLQAQQQQALQQQALQQQVQQQQAQQAQRDQVQQNQSVKEDYFFDSSDDERKGGKKKRKRKTKKKKNKKRGYRGKSPKKKKTKKHRGKSPKKKKTKKHRRKRTRKRR
tara:strand:+ start:452 stop:1093 length:642 start_codon:yes stop_codon:yes gene_type:complete